MFFNMYIVIIVNAIFSHWTFFRLFVNQIIRSEIIRIMKDARIRNEIDHTYTIIAILNIIYFFHVNHSYDFFMLEHALIVDLFVVSLFSTHFFEIYLDFECDTKMIIETMKNVICFRNILVELILMNVVTFMLSIIFARVVKFSLSSKIKILMIETICNSQNCRQIIRSRLIELSFLFDVIIAQRILINVSLKDQTHILQTWMNFVVSNDKLMINVFHSFRIFEIEWLCSISILRRQNLKSLNLFEIDAHEFQLAKKKIWKKAREHVRRLTQTIDLLIENDMSFQKFSIKKTFTNKREWMKSWMIARDSLYLNKEFLFLNERNFFLQNYVSKTKTHYMSENYVHQFDLIAMIVIFFKNSNFVAMREQWKNLTWEIEWKMIFLSLIRFFCMYFFFRNFNNSHK